jgi:glycosyltransferase involved in cell wall biosynthesis
MKRIYSVRTYYPHWGESTGPHQLIRYLNPDQFKVKEKKVPMGNPIQKISFLKKFFSKNLKRDSKSVYGLNDFFAEASVFLQSLIRKFDIIHLLDAEHTLMYLPDWFRRFRALKPFPKILAMFHQPPYLLDSLIDPKIAEMTDCILVVSPEQKDYFQELMPHKRVELIPLGVETHYFKPPRTEKSAEKFRCLAAGVWLRDYNALLETARLLAEHPGFQFHIVTADLEVPPDLKNVFLHSGLSDQDFLRLYQTSDILFMPMEAATANNVILEGISCGLPILSTDLPSIKYYVPGNEAILIKDNDPAAFAEALLQLSKNRGKLSSMSDLAHKRANELSWEKITLEYEQLYLSI